MPSHILYVVVRWSMTACTKSKRTFSVHQTFVMLFSLSPFGRDHLAFGAGMQGRPWTRTTNIYLYKFSVNIHHNYVNMNECTFEAPFYMYEYSFITIKWNWQTLSEFPGCVCMKKQRFWSSLFTVCLNLKELWNIRTFTCLTFNRKNLGSFKAASCFSSLKPAHSCTWQFAGCTHVLKHTQQRRLCFPFQNLDLLFPSNSEQIWLPPKSSDAKLCQLALFLEMQPSSFKILWPPCAKSS